MKKKLKEVQYTLNLEDKNNFLEIMLMEPTRVPARTGRIDLTKEEAKSMYKLLKKVFNG